MHVGCYRKNDHHLFCIFSERSTKGVLFPISEHKARRTPSTVSTFSMLRPYCVITSGTCEYDGQGVFPLLNALTFPGVANHTSLINLLSCHKMNANFNFLHLLSCVLKFIIIWFAALEARRNLGQVSCHSLFMDSQCFVLSVRKVPQATARWDSPRFFSRLGSSRWNVCQPNDWCTELW